MEKLIASIFCFILLFNVTSLADGVGDITVKLDGTPMIFQDQQPVIKDGRTLVPARVIFEKLGLRVDWDGATSTIIASNDSKKIEFVINNLEAKIDDSYVNLDIPAQIINNQAMVG